MSAVPFEESVARVRIPGCGEALGSVGRFHTDPHVAAEQTCFLINRAAASRIAIGRVGIDPSAIETVLLAQLHGHHFAGLPWVIVEGQIARARTRPLSIVRPRGTRASASSRR